MKTMPVSLRTAASEQRYQDHKKAGLTHDITKLPYKKMYGLRMVENEYIWDIAYERGAMLLANGKGLLHFIIFWLKLGVMYYRNNSGDFDQLAFNFVHKLSQPHIPHAHLLKFKKSRKDFKL